MEKPNVSVTFEGVPEEDEKPGRPAGTPGGRPRPPFRARAFTTGSLWEILSSARSSPTHGAGRGWMWEADAPGDGMRGTRLITDYVHLDRRHRRRHWSEFDAGGSRQREARDGNGVAPDASSRTSGAEVPTIAEGGRLRPAFTKAAIPKPHQVAMRLEPRAIASKVNRNRNSLLANAYISKSLQFLPQSKKRSRSAPADPDHPSADEDPFGAPLSALPTLWRAPFFSRGAFFIADSTRSIASRCQRSSVNSAGSGDADDDDDLIGEREECLTPSGTFNVSSGSSISVPSYRVAVVGQPGPEKTRLLHTFVSLGELGDDDDDVFLDSEGPEMSAYISFDAEEYYLTFIDVAYKDLSQLSDVDVCVMLTNGNPQHEKMAAVLDKLPCPCAVLQWRGSGASSKDKSELEQLMSKNKVPLLELTSDTDAAALELLRRIVLLLQGGLGPENPETGTEGTRDLTTAIATASSAGGTGALLGRTRKKPGLSLHDVPVDKQTLFNRFFRRTLSTKSCDNLLAL